MERNPRGARSIRCAKSCGDLCVHRKMVANPPLRPARALASADFASAVSGIPRARRWLRP